MSNVNVILDNYSGCYYPGDTILGKLECYFNEPIKFRAIKITCKGKETTQWSETESYHNSTTNRRETRTVTYSGNRTFYSFEIPVITSRNGNSKLPAGRHIFPFSIHLPVNIPSTYTHHYGDVKYKITGVVDRPWRFDFSCELYLNIFAPIDLNTVPAARDSITLADEKHLCCFCCKSGPISVEVTVPHKGFAPGEIFTCSAYVQNLTNKSIERIEFKLQQFITFTTQSPSTQTKSDKNTLASAIFGQIGAHGEHNFTIEVAIPDGVYITNFNNCNLFEDHYEFSVKAVLPSPHTNLKATAPVIMGHIKLGLAAPFVPSGTIMPLPTAPQPCSQVPYDEALNAPPTYEQVMRESAVPSQPTAPMPPV